MFLLNPWCGKDIDHNIPACWSYSRFIIRTLKKGTDNPFFVTKNNFIFFTADHLPRDSLKCLSFLGKVKPPFALETIHILNGHKNSMAHLGDDMRIDKEVDNRKSHFNGPLKMTWKGAWISPFFEKLIVEIDPRFELGKVSPPPHLTKKLSFGK